MKEPRRRVQVHITIGADSWHDAILAMRHFEEKLSDEERDGRHEITVVSGWPTWGGNLMADEDDSITHDLYSEAVARYLGEEAV